MGLHLLSACLLYHTPAHVSQVTTRVAPHSFPAAPVQSRHLRVLIYLGAKNWPSDRSCFLLLYVQCASASVLSPWGAYP